MHERLGKTQAALYPRRIGMYESGRRKPALPVLLQYARGHSVPLEILIDNEQDLPARSLAGTTWVLKGEKVWQRRRCVD
jgi:hypothetical protein